MQSWAGLEPYFQRLLERQVQSAESLEQWLRDRSELEALLSETLGRRYVRMTRDTGSRQARAAYQQFVREISPQQARYHHALNKKLLVMANTYLLEGTAHENLLRHTRAEVELFREANVPLLTKLEEEQQAYGALVGEMSVTVGGKQYTLPQATDFLLDPDRATRERVYRLIQERRLQDSDQLNALFDQLVTLRHRVAQQADLPNFRDYMFRALGRFDYTPADCFDFHASVAEVVQPLLDRLTERRRQNLGVTHLRPWDHSADEYRRPPLVPFKNVDELFTKVAVCFRRLDSAFGEVLSVMRSQDHLDLESRPRKAPGGYNYPMDETGVPFIFMNATRTMRDVVTLLHEGGHALHSFAMHRQPLTFFRHPPSEVAELASMSMELLTIDYWDLFFEDEVSLRRARYEHLLQIVETFTWVATIDQFQHWLYEHPEHSREERTTAWLATLDRFSDHVTDWSGLENYRANLWHKQLHLYEVPFYYVEYGFAQLGAVALWKNYRQDRAETLRRFKAALAMGYTAPVPDIYAAAGIRFDFSAEYLRELFTFLEEEIEANAPHQPN